MITLKLSTIKKSYQQCGKKCKKMCQSGKKLLIFENQFSI